MARWCIRVVVGGALLLMATSLIVANSPVVSSKVRAEIAAATGCVVEMDRARIDLDGRVEIKNLRLSIPGVAGPEALLLSAEEAEIDLSWAAALSWSGLSAVKPTSIRLEKPLFRLSQSLDDGSLNLGGLATAGGGSAGSSGGARAAVPSIPTVNVQDGRIEFAEHSAKQARFEVLNTVHVAGAFASNADGSYRIRMQEIGRLAPPRIEGEPQLPRGMILDGRVDLQRAEAVLRLLNVPLEAWPPESVPTAYREAWRRLRIQGRIRETMFEYDRAGGVRLSIWPEDVAMDIPVPAESDAAADNLSLGSVNGVLTLSREGLAAELQGVFEEQTKPVHVKFRTEGADMNAPLVCEIWGEGLTLARNPGFLPYIPPTAREFFVFFSGPTGEVDAKVTIARGPPVDGAPAPVVVTDGRLNVRNGTAAFHLFPYPFHNMEVKATFDENHLNLLDIRGDGPTGAKVTASSQAAPMTSDARVDVSVYVTGVPVDEHLRAAMPGSRKQLLDVLFNEERYAELLAAGLVRPAGSPEVDGAAPVFAMGGVCEIDVTVVRPFGKDVEWSTDVVVRIPVAGVVPKPFPYPIIARDVELHITDKDGTLTRGTFAGLRGGRAELSAHVQLTEGDSNVLKPKLDIAAFDVPVDDLLIHAVPDDEFAGEPGAVSAKAILRRLAISGNVDCTAKIRDAGDGSEDIDYDVAVDLKGIDARPRQTEGEYDGTRMLVSGASGRIRVTPRAVHVEELGGRLVSERVEAALAGAVGGAVEAESCGEFVLALDARIVPPRPRPEVGPPEPGVVGAIGLSVDVRGLDLIAPLPSLLRVFNEEVAGVLSEMRQERSPAGRVDATIRLDLAEGAQRPTVTASFSEFEDVSFDAIAGRVCLLDVAGGASFVDRDDPDPRRRSTLGFESFAANIEYAGEAVGSIALDGRFSLNPDAAEGELLERTMADAELSVRLMDSRFESRLVADVLALGLAESTLASWNELKVAGRFDAEFELVGEPVEIVGMIGPRSIGFERPGGRVELPAVVGHVTFHAAADAERPGERALEGRIEGLACRAETWRADATGGWTFAAGEGLELETALAFECERLSEQLFAVLPEAAVEALRAVDLRIDGGFSMPAARLVARIPSHAAGPGSAAGPHVRFDAQARFAGASADLGVPLRECDGEVSIGVESVPGEDAAVLIELAAPTLTLAGIGMTGASAVLESDEAGSGGLSVPFFSASCHGGRIWGSATIGAEEHEKRAYAADVLAAGVLFAPLLDELGAMKSEEAAPPVVEEARTEPESPHEPTVRPPDRTRGQADLWLTMSGVTGDAGSRIGRGAIRVANGDVLRLPVVLPLVQMSNLMLPSRDRFGYLQAEFHVRGQTVLFESIAVLSDSVSLMGDGTATLPELTLDMRFNSRSNNRVPLLSDVYEALRDEILTTRVRGTVASPDVRSETLTTTRGILDGLFDPGRGVQGSIRNDDAARREELRARDALRSERPLPPTTMPSLPTGVDG